MTKPSQSNWFSIEISVPTEAVEAVEFALNSVDALGTSINHLRKANSENTIVIGYFNSLPDEQFFQDELHYALQSYGFSDEIVSTVSRDEIENADWLAEWKKHWKPTEVGGFVIAPPWETVSEDEKIVIRIEPNMAFGTGTHETTQLCLAQVENFYTPGDSFLDVGTGTGILSIAAAKLGGDGRILACDTDTDSVKIARENAELNDVGNRIEFYEGSISPDTAKFDFVCANLTIDVILPLLDLLLEKTGKTLVLSGVLVEQKATIVSALEQRGVLTPRIERLGEWISIALSRVV